MQLRPVLLSMLILGGGGLMKVAEAQDNVRDALMIADFEEDDVLERTGWNDGVSVSLTEADAVSGARSLEVRVKPFSEHGNKWPYVFFNDRYFRTPADLSPYSKIVCTIRNVTEGLQTVRLTFSSMPYNDGGRNLEGEGFPVPGGSSMQCEIATSIFRYKLNDPSAIRMMMFIFPATEVDAVYRIETVSAVYDPAAGSPAETLRRDADSALRQVELLEAKVNWAAVPEAERTRLQTDARGLVTEAQAVLTACEAVRTTGFAGKFNERRAEVTRILRRLGEFVLADKQGAFLWERSPYTYVYRDEFPDFETPTVTGIALRMAQNEFRHTSFMASACGRDVRLALSVETDNPASGAACDLRESIFYHLSSDVEYGDALAPLSQPLTIPRGESREIWLRFDTRWNRVPPGDYTFSLTLRDLDRGDEQTLPGTLRVWDFALPSYDVYPCNAYAEYHNSDIGAHVLEQGVRHMKMYGINTTYILPNELPWPVDVDDQLRITHFDATYLAGRIGQLQGAWDAAPGDETLTWIFALTGAPERLLRDKSVPMSSREWKEVFPQWLARFQAVLRDNGIDDANWMLVLCDEASEAVLSNYEVPFAEFIKRIDPGIRLTCNASQVISDEALAARFHKAFDVFQPCLDSIEALPYLLDWTKRSGKPIWTYRCKSMSGRDRDLYDYYRVYAWRNLAYGITGTGLWTYCAQGASPWSDTKHSANYNLVLKHPDKDEVLHSRRYEFFREGADDYRYVAALRERAAAAGADAAAQAEALIRRATDDILADVGDEGRCEKWRARLAQEILKLKHP